MSLFRTGKFSLHSGAVSDFKIDADFLSNDDWSALAAYAVAHLLPPFGEVEGVPTGGLSFANHLGSWATEGPLLIVDDVLTTGDSMEEQRGDRDAVGLVVFARGALPLWVVPMFIMVPPLNE